MNPCPVAILVIERHPLMREALCVAISDEPELVVVAEAVNGAEALGLPATLKLDVILLAVGNPGLDDLEFIRALRLARPATPILALTTNEIPEQQQAALAAGAQVVLTKAAPRVELLHTLRTLPGHGNTLS